MSLSQSPSALLAANPARSPTTAFFDLKKRSVEIENRFYEELAAVAKLAPVFDGASTAKRPGNASVEWWIYTKTECHRGTRYKEDGSVASIMSTQRVYISINKLHLRDFVVSFGAHNALTVVSSSEAH